jgi:hypothetical protein
LVCCPKIPGDFEGRDLEIGPPRNLVPKQVQVTMVIAAQRHGELVAHLATERARLCKFEVVRIARRASAHKAGL